MSLAPDVDLEEFVHTKDDLSGADIKAIATEAGLLALRERRMQVTMADMRSAREKVLYRKKDESPAGLVSAVSPLSNGPLLPSGSSLTRLALCSTCKLVVNDALQLYDVQRSMAMLPVRCGRIGAHCPTPVSASSLSLVPS